MRKHKEASMKHVWIIKLFQNSRSFLNSKFIMIDIHYKWNFSCDYNHIGVKILFYPRSETVGSLLETKGISGPPPFGRTRECANYNSICPYGFRYHQSRDGPPLATLFQSWQRFVSVITSILPLIFLSPRGHIRFLSDIISIDIFC